MKEPADKNKRKIRSGQSFHGKIREPVIANPIPETHLLRAPALHR